MAVFGGVVGCLLLIRRRSAVAALALALSLLGVVVQMGHAFLFADAFRLVGPQARCCSRP